MRFSLFLNASTTLLYPESEIKQHIGGFSLFLAPYVHFYGFVSDILDVYRHF